MFINIIKTVFLTLAFTSIAFANTQITNKEERIKEISKNINIGFENSKDSEFVFNEKENINYEVIYFFSYGCPHCYSFKNYLKEWEQNKKDDVNIHFIPATFQKGWENLAKGHIIAKDLRLNNFDETIFNYIHKDKNFIRNMDDLRTFFNDIYNVENSIFNSLYNSIEINMEIEKLNKITDDFEIMGTPTLLLITKKGHSYVTSPSIANGNLNMIFTMEYLMMKDRKQLKKITQPE